MGGMTWCITASNEDVDVDVLFEENANIGAKMLVSRSVLVLDLPPSSCRLLVELAVHAHLTIYV